jgi:uncharacterized membrane protein
MPESQGPESAPDPPDPVEDLKALFQPVRSFHADHPVYFWLALVSVVGAVFGLAAVLWPETVIDQFLCKNFWGPTETDARQIQSLTRNGVKATTNYTLLSELIYGLILAGALVSIYHHLFKKRGIRVDKAFIAALLPYVFFGPIARSMEDASVFCQQATPTIEACDPGLFSWLFISPFIYVVTAAAVILHLLMAYHSREATRSDRLQIVGTWLGVQAAGYSFVFYAMRDQFVALLDPIWVVGFAALAFGVYYLATDRGGSHLHWALASWGLPMVLTPSAMVVAWQTQARWVDAPRPGVDLEIPIVLALTAGVVAMVWGIGYLFRENSQRARFLMNPLNLGLVSGHMIDGFATFTAICSNPGGICSGAGIFGLTITDYAEKHQVSEVFLGFGDGWGFPIAKLLLVLAIILLVDQAKIEDDEDPDLIGLVKLAVLVLGLAPGTRNAIRVAMGV